MTQTTTTEFRDYFLVYGLERQPDGFYVALNRHYKPVGMTCGDWVKYEDHPVRLQFKRALTPKQAASLSASGDPSTDRIYLYNDGCVPTSSAAAWNAYSARLQRLAGLLVVTHL